MLTSKLLATAQNELDFSFIETPRLSEYTTFRIGGPAAFAVFPNTISAFAELIKLLKAYNEPYCVLGNGSNILFADSGFKGTVIITSRMNRISSDGFRITAECGASLIKLACFAGKHSLSGLEFAYGIPGSVGGAVYMNAGAYGGEISEVLESCLCFDTANLTETKFDRDECDFGYRSSLFIKNPGRYILLQATFALSSGNADEIKAAMNDYMSRRREKQPLEYPSAGSVFKRAPGYFTAKLIDDAGLKGKRIGGAQISEKHAGFIVNVGNATAKDVMALIALTKETVHEKFNVDIECEIRFLGDSEKQ